MLVEKHKCLVDAPAKDQITPLLLAATSGHEDVVGYLLDNKADMHAVRVSQPLYTYYPLHLELMEMISNCQDGRQIIATFALASLFITILAL